MDPSLRRKNSCQLKYCRVPRSACIACMIYRLYSDSTDLAMYSIFIHESAINGKSPSREMVESHVEIQVFLNNLLTVPSGRFRPVRPHPIPASPSPQIIHSRLLQFTSPFLFFGGVRCDINKLNSTRQETTLTSFQESKTKAAYE